MNKNNITEEEITEEIEIETSRMDNGKLTEVISEEKRVISKTSKLDIRKFSRFIKQMKLAISLVKDFRNKSYTEIPWRSIAMIAAAILYFINPFDMVPDMLPVFGIADDAMLFATVFKSIQTDLIKYGDWKGINTEDYF
jgi:uncharacterized membrane protein YkvA (DUF1232 family)